MTKTFFSAAAILAASMLTSQADVIVLDFEGVANEAQIGSFYNGVGGPDYDITFGENALAVIDSDVPGGTGNFANEPSPSTVMFFLTGSAVLNVPNGFDTGFSFFYTSPFEAGSVVVYDGLNATGNILGSFLLPTTPLGVGDPTGDYNVFVPVGVAFAGTALSVDFIGAQNNIAFDDITFGSATPGVEQPVPEPATVIGGLALGALVLRRTMRKK